MKVFKGTNFGINGFDITSSKNLIEFLFNFAFWLSFSLCLLVESHFLENDKSPYFSEGLVEPIFWFE